MKKEKRDTRLLAVQDEFIEFHDYCAFLCDAIEHLLSGSENEKIDTFTVMGLKRQCADLKESSRKLGSELSKL